MQPVIVVFAPTATGKTALALNLFGRGSPYFFKPVELISADSMQVYKDFNIGTAKPDSKELSLLPHHLIDIRDGRQQYNVDDFVEDADRLCDSLHAEGKIPLVLGGTGFYIRNFLLGKPTTPPSDKSLRENLIKESLEVGPLAMHKRLMEVDPESASKINVNDQFRVLRALEIYLLTGKKRSDFAQSSTLRSKYDFRIIILERHREDLYNRINERVDLMFEMGLVDEVRDLYNKGYDSSAPAFQAIGYKEFFNNGVLRTDYDNIRTEIKHNSRKYAKKQYTYMTGIPSSHRVLLTPELDSMKDEIRFEGVINIIKDVFI